jgi:ABC-type sugar transport system permease subunit
LLPTTIFLAVTLIIGASQGFGLIALITAGGPGDSTTTISYYMYQTGFQFYRFGYASAIGLVTFAGVLVLTLLTWRAQRGRSLHD